LNAIIVTITVGKSALFNPYTKLGILIKNGISIVKMPKLID
jgi:hypothetical protein